MTPGCSTRSTSARDMLMLQVVVNRPNQRSSGAMTTSLFSVQPRCSAARKLITICPLATVPRMSIRFLLTPFGHMHTTGKCESPNHTRRQRYEYVYAVHPFKETINLWLFNPFNFWCTSFMITASRSVHFIEWHRNFLLFFHFQGLSQLEIHLPNHMKRGL